MAIVPTQLLGFADGTLSQGFSTMYDMKLLSTYNVKNPQETDPTKIIREDADEGQYSWLLVKGKISDKVQGGALNVFVTNGDSADATSATHAVFTSAVQ